MSDIIEVTITDSDIIEVSLVDQIIIGGSETITLTENLAIGLNRIPHLLGRKVSYLTSFLGDLEIFLDWTSVDPDTYLDSTTELFIRASSVYNDVTINIL
jgi:hypothetical protein